MKTCWTGIPEKTAAGEETPLDVVGAAGVKREREDERLSTHRFLLLLEALARGRARGRPKAQRSPGVAVGLERASREVVRSRTFGRRLPESGVTRATSFGRFRRRIARLIRASPGVRS